MQGRKTENSFKSTEYDSGEKIVGKRYLLRVYTLSFTCLHVTFLHERAIGICDICQLVQGTEILSSFYINPSRRSQVLFIFSPVPHFRKRFRQHSRHQAIHRKYSIARDWKIDQGFCDSIGCNAAHELLGDL